MERGKKRWMGLGGELGVWLDGTMGWMEGWVDGGIGARMYGGMGGWINGVMGNGTNGEMDVQINGGVGPVCDLSNTLSGLS